MVNASLISRLSHAVDLIEQRSQQNRPLKVVTVRRSYAGFWVTGDQAAWFAGMRMTSMPSLNLTPAITFGN